MNDRKQLLHGYLAALATLIMWTGFSLVSRIGGKSVLTPYEIFALRLVTASLVLLPFAGCFLAGKWRDKRLWLLAFLGSLLYCLLVYHGFRFAPAASTRHAGRWPSRWRRRWRRSRAIRFGCAKDGCPRCCIRPGWPPIWTRRGCWLRRRATVVAYLS